jgi:hypothetical protein
MPCDCRVCSAWQGRADELRKQVCYRQLRALLQGDLSWSIDVEAAPPTVPTINQQCVLIWLSHNTRVQLTEEIHQIRLSWGSQAAARVIRSTHTCLNRLTPQIEDHVVHTDLAQRSLADTYSSRSRIVLRLLNDIANNNNLGRFRYFSNVNLANNNSGSLILTSGFGEYIAVKFEELNMMPQGAAAREDRRRQRAAIRQNGREFRQVVANRSSCIYVLAAAYVHDQFELLDDHHQIFIEARPLQEQTALVPLTRENLRNQERRDRELRFFACGDCHFVWYQKVFQYKPVSRCRRCQQSYKAKEIDDEPVGLGKFKCTICAHQWTSFPAARNVAQRCFSCSLGCFKAQHVIPDQRWTGDEEERFRTNPSASGFRHECYACNGEFHCPLRNRNLLTPSVRHTSTGSTISLGSNEFTRLLSDDSVNRWRNQGRMRPHNNMAAP